MQIAWIVLAAALSTAPQQPPQAAAQPDRVAQKRYYDCHRDVRTHRIGGVLVTHRHVGEDCQVRVVKKMNSF